MSNFAVLQKLTQHCYIIVYKSTILNKNIKIKNIFINNPKSLRKVVVLEGRLVAESTAKQG